MFLMLYSGYNVKSSLINNGGIFAYKKLLNAIATPPAITKKSVNPFLLVNRELLYSVSFVFIFLVLISIQTAPIPQTIGVTAIATI